MKIDPKEAEYREARRQRGEPTSGQEAEARTTWEEYQGWYRILEAIAAAKNPMLPIQIATGAVKPPVTKDLKFELSTSVVRDPNRIDDPVNAIWHKHAAAVKELVDIGGLPKEWLAKIPEMDPKRRLLGVHVPIGRALKKSGMANKEFVRRLREICRKLGEEDFNRLPPEMKSKVLTGDFVHPLSTKEVHRQLPPRPAASHLGK
jgi:hypothetical protein